MTHLQASADLPEPAGMPAELGPGATEVHATRKALPKPPATMGQEGPPEKKFKTQ